MPLNPLRHVQIQLMRQCIADQSFISAQQRVGLETVLRAVTINPARHIGMEHMPGSLETGKEADLTIVIQLARSYALPERSLIGASLRPW